MRVSILYPPLHKEGRFPTLGQNRQFKFTNTSESFPPPIVPGYAATMLKEDGHDVFWHDGIINRMTLIDFNKKLFEFNPDVVMLETKTPLMYRHWKYVNFLKENMTVKVVLVGDHVSWMPEESMVNSKVDFVITSGDYDYGMRSVCDFINTGKKLRGGIWYREGTKVKNSGPLKLCDNLDTLPFIDWDLIGLHYHEAYLYQPSGYLMSGRGCGGGPRGVGSCSFCIWQHALWKLTPRLRSPAHVAEEIAHMLDKYKFKEIFDDNENGAVYNKKWLTQFYRELDARGIIDKVIISSNSRADNLDRETCVLLKKAGYRLLKVGLESGNNETLKRINKKETVEDISLGVRNAKDHGLRVKLTTMTGFPWETEGDVRQTYNFAKKLMLYKTRFGDCLQSSVIVAYPGSPLYYESLKNDWFTIDPYNYDQYDMAKPILKCSYDSMAWCEKIWKILREPKFMIKTLFSVRSISDIKLGLTGFKSLKGHEADQKWGAEFDTPDSGVGEPLDNKNVK